MKSYKNWNYSVLGQEEMFNIRGGDGEETAGSTTSTNNSTAQGADKDIIL